VPQLGAAWHARSWAPHERGNKSQEDLPRMFNSHIHIRGAPGMVDPDLIGRVQREAGLGVRVGHAAMLSQDG
jgi:hypothetical protein